MILGTAAYMSPEQARGQPLNKRTDIWSFGCVLYELLTGQKTFAADTLSDTVVRILGQEPDWKMLPATTPASIRLLLRRCLEKDWRRVFMTLATPESKSRMHSALPPWRSLRASRLLAPLPPHGAHFAGVWLSWSCLPSPALSSGK